MSTQGTAVTKQPSLTDGPIRPSKRRKAKALFTISEVQITLKLLMLGNLRDKPEYTLEQALSLPARLADALNRKR